MAKKLCVTCGNHLIPHCLNVSDTISGESFDIYLCPRCQLGHTYPKPQNMSYYYRENYYGNRHGFTRKYCISRRLNLVERISPFGYASPNGKRLLDIGCGDGSFLHTARSKGWDVTGIELNPEPARNIGIEVVTGLDRLVTSPLFDCVTMWHSLEHMADPVTTLKQIRNILTLHGKLIIAVPNYGGFQAKQFGNLWWHLDVPRHLFHFNHRSLSFMLKLTGFDVIEHRNIEPEYDIMGAVQSTLNALNKRQNILFDFLSHKRFQPKVPLNQLAFNFTIGGLLALLWLPLAFLNSWDCRGATLIMAAR